MRRLDPYFDGRGFENYNEEKLKNDQQAVVITCTDLGLNGIINRDGSMPPQLLITSSQESRSDPPLIILDENRRASMGDGGNRSSNRHPIEKQLVHILPGVIIPPSIKVCEDCLAIPDDVLKQVATEVTKLLAEHADLGVFKTAPWKAKSKDGLKCVKNDVKMAFVAIKESGELPLVVDTFEWSDSSNYPGPATLGSKKRNGLLRLMENLGLENIMAGRSHQPNAANVPRNTLFVHGVPGNAKVFVFVPWKLHTPTAISSHGGTLSTFTTLGTMKTTQRTNAYLLISAFGQENAKKLWRKDPRNVTDADLLNSAATRYNIEIPQNSTDVRARSMSPATAAEDGSTADERRIRPRIKQQSDVAAAASDLPTPAGPLGL